MIFRFVPTDLIGLRFKLQPAAVEPTAAVVKCGKLLVLVNGLPPGHVPIKYAQDTTVQDVRSQGGDHLGRVVVDEVR